MQSSFPINFTPPALRSCRREPGPDSEAKMADESNGELTADELKAEEHKLEANKYFKGRF